jgi:hypothetical protein
MNDGFAVEGLELRCPHFGIPLKSVPLSVWMATGHHPCLIRGKIFPAFTQMSKAFPLLMTANPDSLKA